MIARARFKSVLWVLLAVIALAPTSVLAQQDSARQSQNQRDEDQPDLTLPVPSNPPTEIGGLDEQVQELGSDHN